MDETWNYKEVMKHLDDTKYYAREIPDLPGIYSEIVQILLNNKVKENTFLFSLIASPKDFANSTKNPQFYIIPKLHKIVISSRPIVPSNCWITTNASKWLDSVLSPFLKNFDWIVENSINTITALTSIKPFTLPNQI